MFEYLFQIKVAIDQLASVGHLLTFSDQIKAIFDGIPTEYDNFIISVNSRLDPYSVYEIKSLFLAQEGKIEKKVQELDSMSPNTVNFTTNFQSKHTFPIQIFASSSHSYTTEAYATPKILELQTMSLLMLIIFKLILSTLVQIICTLEMVQV